MKQEEIASVCSWAVNVSAEYGVPITKIVEIYKAMREFKDMKTVKNDIEAGFIEARKGGTNESRYTKE